jgi:hypothetical protein
VVKRLGLIFRRQHSAKLMQQSMGGVLQPTKDL